MHVRNFCRQNTELFYKLFTRATESGWSMGGCNFRNILPINVPKCYGGKIFFFDRKFSKSSEFYYMEPGVFPSITDIVEAMNILNQERRNHSKNCIKVKVLEERKKLRFTLQMKNPVLHSLARIWDTISEVSLVMNLEYCWKEKDFTNQNFLTTLLTYTLSWYTPAWLSTISFATRKLHCCVGFLLFRGSSLETI